MTLFEGSEHITRLRQFFEHSVDAYPHHIALVVDGHRLSYQELEARTNQLAHYLISLGIHEGHSVGLFLERSLASYVSMLAVLKTGAAYVPIDVDYPDERVNHILADMPFQAVITSSRQFLRHTSIHFPEVVVLDTLTTTLAEFGIERPPQTPTLDDSLCYVIYTSGSTGRPKGVEVTHRNICHYVSVASTLYEMTSEDIVYQGFSLAFDASLEELWMAFANGATLVACLSKDIRSGVGLIDFLNEHQVSVFSTVPTLLSTLEPALPQLRLLILGGEACTAALIKRWSRPDLILMNTYGPTEATVIATATVCHPDESVSIGYALPGYEIFIVDEQQHPVPDETPGELCIAGKGVARGYVHREDLTASKFIQHPHHADQRMYRTGDLAVKTARGDIQFMGRMDDQVKLRGFRIELNEIEQIILEHDGVRQAVVALVEMTQPILVAYVMVQDSFDPRPFKQFLEHRLPHYMLPSVIEVVASFPLLPSGKINRNALPKPSQVIKSDRYVAPSNALERKIAGIWEQHLQHQPISIEDDFFYDLGGHSLSAATIVSHLRRIPSMKQISMLDLYQNPTIQQLAKKCKQKDAAEATPDKQAEKYRPKPMAYYLCAAGQWLGCLFQYAISAWQLLAVIVAYTWISTHTEHFSKEAVFLFFALFIAMPVVSIGVTIAAKWILLGRVKPGVYKLWGWFYLRWWLVNRLQDNVFSPKHLMGSPLIILYYRLLGAKIGKNCFIDTTHVSVHDLLTIGDHSSIGCDARLLGYVVEDGWLKIGTIGIGDHCFIGARSVVGINASMEDHAVLDDMSLLPIDAHMPKKTFYSGSPACFTQPAPEHMTQQITDPVSPAWWKSPYYGLLHYIGLVFSMMVYYACYLPALLLITYFHEQTHYLLTVLIAAPLGALIFLGLYYTGICSCKYLLMRKIKPGIYSLYSLYYVRQWITVKMFDTGEVDVMADTLYFPYLLRFMGATLGKRVEMGETPHLIPDLITIQDEGFTASAVALAWPTVYEGCIRYAPIRIGKRGFVGNDSLLPLGAHVGDGGLIGCMSITPPNNQAAHDHTAWLGSPAMFLPRREEFTGYTDTEKFTPQKRLIYIRLAIEFARIMMPTFFTLVGLFQMLCAVHYLLDHESLLTTICVIPLAQMLITMGLVALVVALKWIVLGRLQPMTRPIWHVFIWKNDFVKYLYSYFVEPMFVNVVLGTPFLPWLYRLFGSKIGHRVFLNTGDVGEFDLIDIGDDVCINNQVAIQTHLYEDRIFKMSTIDIADGCNVGVASIVLYSTVMEKNATLGDFSLLMKGERLPKQSNWQGIPAQHMKAHRHDTPSSIPIMTVETMYRAEVDIESI